MGTKHRPFYRIVATNKQAPRESRYIELLGQYDPMSAQTQVKVDLEKYNSWIQKGAIPSETVKSLIKKVGSDN
jgi:small subunit ribosomal protein S16